MAGMQISNDALAYTLEQIGLAKKLIFGDLPWEAYLLAQEVQAADGCSFGKVILGRLLLIKQRDGDNSLHRTARDMLALVYAPVFYECHSTLPFMEKSDYDAVEAAYEDKPLRDPWLANLSEYVRINMRRMNGQWSDWFFTDLSRHDFTPADRAFLLCCTRLLLTKVGEKSKQQKSTTPPSASKPTSKPETKNDPADKWAKLLQRELKPVMDTGVTFADVGGCRQAKLRMKELSWLLAQPDAVARWGVPVPRGILLYGPPGTGKTLLVRALAKHTGRALYKIKMSDIFSMWYSQSVEYLSRIFIQAKAAKGAILFLDEADGVISSRSRQHSHEESNRVVTQFNIEMEEIQPGDNLTVVLATNIKEKLDEASVRDQRIDLMIQVSLPDMAEREEILQVHKLTAESRTGYAVFAPDIRLSALAAISDGLSGAALAHVIERALWEKALHDIRDGINEPVCHDDLLRSVRARLAERKDSERHRIGFSIIRSEPEIVSEDSALTPLLD